MKPLIYTFGYHGWGSHVKLMKATFLKENQKNRGRSLRWIDVRLKRNCKASGFNEQNVEKLIGQHHYRWIPELGNKGIEEGGGLWLKEPERGYEKLYNEIYHAEKDGMDLILFCHCEEYEYCHRSFIVDESPEDMLEYYPKTGETEFPPQSVQKLDLTSSKKLKVNNKSIRIPFNTTVQGYTSAFTIASGVITSYNDNSGQKQMRIIRRVIPDSEEKNAILWT